LAFVVLVATVATAALPSAEVHGDTGANRALIGRAGNAEDNRVRLACLKQLQKVPNLDESLKDDLDRLVAEIDRWIHARNVPHCGGQIK